MRREKERYKEYKRLQDIFLGKTKKCFAKEIARIHLQAHKSKKVRPLDDVDDSVLHKESGNHLSVNFLDDEQCTGSKL